MGYHVNTALSPELPGLASARKGDSNFFPKVFSTRTHKHAHTLDYILMYVCKYVRCPGHGKWSSQRRADAMIQSFGALLIEHGSPCNSSLYCSRVASIESRPQTRSSPLTRVWSRRLMLTTLSYQKCRCNPMVRGFY